MSPSIAFVVLFVAAAFLSSVYTLKCSSCQFSSDWDVCQSQSKIRECTVKQVNRYHGDMRDNNPTLEELDEATKNVTFSCFSMKLETTEAGVSQSGVISGCTLKQQKICEGWTNETTVTNCHMCESEKICSSGNRSLVGSSVEMAMKLAFVSAVLVISKVFR